MLCVLSIFSSMHCSFEKSKCVSDRNISFGLMGVYMGFITAQILIYQSDLPQKIGNNIIMLDPERKHSILCSRANYQLREIQYNCRQVVTMSKLLSTLSSEVASSQVNCKKIQFFKSEIKDKLKEFASSIDEIYKMMDKKIQLIIQEVKKIENKQEKVKTENVCSKCSNRSMKGQQALQKLTNSQTERMFSDTLNPRVTQLQSKIAQFQANQVKLKYKIAELTNKNQALLEEFNRLSTASNKKIKQLTSKISKDSFSLDYQNMAQAPTKSFKNIENPILSNSPIKSKKSNHFNYQTDQHSYQLSHEHSYTSDPPFTGEKPNFLSFGCMPSRTTKTKPVNNLLGGSNVSEQYQRLDRNDRNRRFDILLNKLRNSQQESTDQSQTEQVRVTNEQIGSVFSQNIVQRYQI